MGGNTLAIADSIAAIARGVRDIVALPDPVGEVIEGSRFANGLEMRKVRVPLGVVAVVYEARPNVTIDAAALCLKSGNTAFLRGSSGAIRSNIAIAAALRAGVAKAGLPEDALVLVEDTSREAAVEFMRLRAYVDCLIPRGGPSLIQSILEHATVPYVIDGDGNCHVYVDASADLDQALSIVVNAKTQRPSVCNAAETVLVHAAVADEFVPRLVAALGEAGVTVHGDCTVAALAGGESARVTGFEDLLPTLLELIGARDAIPPGLDGISFVPTLLGRAQEPSLRERVVRRVGREQGRAAERDVV